MTASSLSVLLLGAYPGPAALERYVSGDLAFRLKARGWQVGAVSRRPGRIGRLAELIGVPLLRRHTYDVACLDLYSGAAFFWAEAATLILRRLRKPFVVTLHGGNLPQFSQRFPKRVSRLLKSATAVSSPSGYLASELARFRADIIRIPNGLDLSKYEPSNSKELPNRLIWLRAFHKIYNPSMAVKVVAKVRQKCPGFTLKMIGPDKGDGSLDATTKEAVRLGLEDVVEFTGAVLKEDVPRALAKGGVFLNTTNYDNTPVSVLEALACGLPVVSTNVGGIPYLLNDGETACLCQPGDVIGMAEKVLQITEKPDLRAELAVNGRRLVEPMDWSRVLPQWESLLGRIALPPTSTNFNATA